MKKIRLSMMLLLIIVFFSSCQLSTKGNTLHSFTQRMNKLSESYSLTESGYIFDRNNATLTRFYKFNKNEILVQFKCDDNNNLYTLNLTFPPHCVQQKEEMKFIKNCISAYIGNADTEKELFSQIDFDAVISSPSYDTITAKSGDTDMLIDITDIGVVITVVQNNL